jgi:hypothetical protein
MDIPHIYHGYTSNDIPCISMDIRGIYMMDNTDIYVYTTYIHPVGYHDTWYIHGYPSISHGYRSGRHIHGTYMEYSMYILEIGVPDACRLSVLWGNRNARHCQWLFRPALRRGRGRMGHGTGRLVNIAAGPGIGYPCKLSLPVHQ